MKTKIFTLALVALFALPCMLLADEVVIPLMEVIGMGTIPGDNPLDGPTQSDENPTRPTSFHATINGNMLAISIEEPSIPSAEATVVNASTGSTVLNQQFSGTLSEQIATPGVYVLHIETDGGALVGQFVVQ